MEIPPILKNKWVLIGGGAVILIALVASQASGGGSSMVVSGASGPSDAEVAASRDITLAQMSGQLQLNAGQLQLAISQQAGDVDLAKATLDASLSRYAIDAQAASQSMQYSTSRDIQLAAFASDERRETAAINSQSQIAKWTLDQATANAQIQSDFQLGYAEAANQTQVSLAQMQAQLVSNQLTVSRDVTLAGLASQENMAAINANLQRDTTYSNNSTQQAIYNSMANASIESLRIQTTGQTEQARIAADSANYAAKKADHSNTVGTIGKVLGGIASIFSDPRLKTDVEKIGEYPDGLGVYHYRMAYGGSVQHGVMADEVASLRPWALGPVVDGYQTVNYAAL